MRFDYDSAFERRELEGYERLVHDAMLGDQTLFTRGDGIERLWNVSEPLLGGSADARDVRAWVLGPSCRSTGLQPASLQPRRCRTARCRRSSR